jgi:hypothetical protein
MPGSLRNLPVPPMNEVLAHDRKPAVGRLMPADPPGLDATVDAAATKRFPFARPCMGASRLPDETARTYRKRSE